MKGFSLLEGMIVSLILSLLFVFTYRETNTEYGCINNIAVESYKGGIWKQSGEFPKYCSINQESAQ